MSSTFDDMDGAKVFESSPKFNPGYWYNVRVARIVDRESGYGGGKIVPIEMEIMETNDPSFKPGDMASWVPKQKHGHTFKNNLLAFAIAALGISSKDDIAAFQSVNPDSPRRRTYFQEFYDDATSEANSAAGLTLRVRTRASETKVKQPFTAHNFEPWSPE